MSQPPYPPRSPQGRHHNPPHPPQRGPAQSPQHGQQPPPPRAAASRPAPPRQEPRPAPKRARKRAGLSTKAKALIGIVGFVVVVGSCQNALNNDEQPAAFSTPSATTSGPLASAGGATAALAAAAPAPAGEEITVSRVIDGDTFELADGRTVRVLGIDSCEMKAPETYGGEDAKRAAEAQLTNPYDPITMTAEPGAPDTDRNGRLLRYVQVDGEDFGVHMVQYDHTGVYQGDNDASDAYVQELYANDTKYSSNPPSGRECADPYPAPASGGSVDIDDDDDHNSRDGSIIPACRHKWWC